MDLKNYQGAEIEDARAYEVFKSIDLDGAGAILFDEFCDYAIKQKLDIEDDDDANAMQARSKTSQQVLAQDKKSKFARRKKPKKVPKIGSDDVVDPRIWQELSEKLPVSQSPEDQKRRQEMFKGFDPNGNGYLNFELSRTG